MAYQGWFKYNNVEIVNHARTVLLARALGIGTVVIRGESVDWIEDVLTGGFGFGEGGFGEGGFGGGGSGDDEYGDITNAPWYNPLYPASAEFAGFVCLSMAGIEDSSLEANVIEYIGDGGTSGRSRNATQSLVASFGLVGQTEQGVEYGKRWLARMLKGGSVDQTFAIGSDLTYFRYAGETAVKVHRRDVRLTRGLSVTRVKSSKCSYTMLLTFTLTANDPFEYGEEILLASDVGGDSPSGSTIVASGEVDLIQESCPVYDYTPIYDPDYPALIPSPTAPNLIPEGWNIEDGMPFWRFWVNVEIPPVLEPGLNVIPSILLHSEEQARRVRVSVWPSEGFSTDTQCNPLFSAVVNYLPPNVNFYVDSEQKAAYVWDGSSPVVRRADSVVFSPEANPVEWTSFPVGDGVFFTVDIFQIDGGPAHEGDGTVRANLSLIPKSD